MTRNPGRGYLVRRLSAVRVAAPESGRAGRDGRRREAVEVRQQRANSDVTFFIRALHSPLVAHLVVVVVTRARIHHRQKDSFRRQSSSPFWKERKIKTRLFPSNLNRSIV